ncbi:MAG: hypothetical protein QM765_10730 [Myxococcales bacterium]
MRRVMYVEKKSGTTGEGRIGWVELTRTGRSFTYAGRRLLKVRSGYKYNCIDEETGDRYWVSGPRKDGADHLYGSVVQIDEDARLEYWTQIRGEPERVEALEYRSRASTRTQARTRGGDLSRRVRSQ